MSSACPDENQLASFLRNPASEPSVGAHLASCAICREIVETLAREGALSRSGEATIVSTPPTAEGKRRPLDATRAEGQRSSGRAADGASDGEARRERFGRYVVRGELGRGGMGAVVAAYDPELDRRVAVKVLFAEPGARSQARLQREARAMAKVLHPNVVVVHDVGALDDGRVFVAMEHVDGGTLQDAMGDHHVSLRRRIEILLAAGEGLCAAHAAGVVHRDFKPSNILVAKDGRVKVSDFGLARFWTSSPDDAHIGEHGPLTRPGAIVGTPAYMSPEQFDGLPADARSDQFSFAVCVWQVLTGERPFPGKGMEQIAHAIRSGHLRTASIPPQMPAAIFAVLERALSRDPAARYLSMRELLGALYRAGLARVGDTRHGSTSPHSPEPTLPAHAPRAGATSAIAPAHAPSGFRESPSGSGIGLHAHAPPRSQPATDSGPWPYIALGVLLLGVSLGVWFLVDLRSDAIEQAGGAKGAPQEGVSAQVASGMPTNCKLPQLDPARLALARAALSKTGGPAVADHGVAMLRKAEEDARFRRETLCEAEKVNDPAIQAGRVRCLLAQHAEVVALVEYLATHSVDAPYETLSRIARISDVGACSMSDDVAVAFPPATPDAALLDLGKLRASLLAGESITARATKLVSVYGSRDLAGLRAEVHLLSARSIDNTKALDAANRESSGLPSVRARIDILFARHRGVVPDDRVFARVDTRAYDVLVEESERAVLDSRHSERMLSWLGVWASGPSVSRHAMARATSALMLRPSTRKPESIVRDAREIAGDSERILGREHPDTLVAQAALACAEQLAGDAAAGRVHMEAAIAEANAALRSRSKIACGKPRPPFVLDRARDREAYESARMRIAAIAAIMGVGAARGEIHEIEAIARRCGILGADAKRTLRLLAERLADAEPGLAATAESLLISRTFREL